MAVATGIYWNKLSPGRGNVNSTTSSALTDMGGGATFFDNMVEVRARASMNRIVSLCRTWNPEETMTSLLNRLLRRAHRAEHLTFIVYTRASAAAVTTRSTCSKTPSSVMALRSRKSMSTATRNWLRSSTPRSLLSRSMAKCDSGGPAANDLARNQKPKPAILSTQIGVKENMP